jgi:AP endonuclease-1
MPRPARGSQKAIIKREDDDIDSKDIKPATPAIVAKRKADSAPDADSKAQASKAVKKRKSQAKGGEDEMPLVERTAVSSLSKAMYIGAHISAAGGISPIFACMKM